MSFILDALKKSEMERQRQSVPGLIDLPGRPRRRRLPMWAVALGALFGVNLLVLTLVLTRKGPPPVAIARSSAAVPPSAPAETAPPHHFSPLDSNAAGSAPVFAPEIPVAPEEAPMGRAPVARTESGEGAGLRSAHRPDPLLTHADDPPENQELLPTVSEINLTGAQALPELHLDVHVFSTQPADRFVYINMRKYHEGAVLTEGPTVERIRRDGVVLNYQGLRFLVPRQP